MTYEKHYRIEMLRRLYANKCGQIEKAKLYSSPLHCQVLEAEAEAIKAELGIL